MQCAGPVGWLLSQVLLLLFFYLDNGSNTCGIDFHFANDTDESSRTRSASALPDADDLPQIDSLSIFDAEDPNSIPIAYKLFLILNKKFVKEFKVVSELGRLEHSLFFSFQYFGQTFLNTVCG